MVSDTQTGRRQPRPKIKPPRRNLVLVWSPDRASIGRAFELGREGIVLGREAPGIGRIEDGLMSKRHASVSFGGGVHLVEDLGSRNGTFVNGARIESPTVLSPNHVIAMGDSLFVVDQEPAPHLLPANDAEEGEVPELVGASLTTERIRRSLLTAARAGGNVLLLGPTGSGKEIVAGAIHRIAHEEAPFVPQNCAGLGEQLAKSELFGHKKGAFTGADRDRDGAFTDASGGILFLDEVADLPAPVQAMLLRVLEDGKVQPLGSNDSIGVRVRVIAATSRDLESTGFRIDLLARIGTWVLHLPTLIDRRADILPLFEHFHRLKAPKAPPLTAAAAEALLLHPWIENVRGVRAMVLRIAALARGRDTVDLDVLEQAGIQGAIVSMLRGREAEVDLTSTDTFTKTSLERKPSGVPRDPVSDAPGRDEDSERPSREELVRSLTQHTGNITALSAARGWHRTQIYRWLRHYGINRHMFRS
jgi:DNA-binding NtrC family response regulator